MVGACLGARCRNLVSVHGEWRFRERAKFDYPPIHADEGRAKWSTSTHTAHNLREWLSNDLNCTGTAVPDSNKETVKSLLRAKQIQDSGPASVDATAQRNAKGHRKKPKKS